MSEFEKLDKFAEKLLAAKEQLKKMAKMAEAPTNELIKFNDHGQWQLTKSPNSQTEKGEGSPQGDYSMITPGG